MFGPGTLDEGMRRRSIYFQDAPDMQVTFLKVFDAANPNECFERNESIVPHQALALALFGLSVHPVLAWWPRSDTHCLRKSQCALA